MFQDRIDAGNQLAIALHPYQQLKDFIVIGIPRGGMVTAHAVAKKLQLPLDTILVKKLGHPLHPEYAIGSVSVNGYKLNETITISEEYIRSEVANIQQLLQERYLKYYQSKKPIDLKNKRVILVDDGIATGSTLIAAIDQIKAQKVAQIIVAVPVAPPAILNKIRPQVDELICLIKDPEFSSVGFHYCNFKEVSDQEVFSLINQHMKK